MSEKKNQPDSVSEHLNQDVLDKLRAKNQRSNMLKRKNRSKTDCGEWRKGKEKKRTKASNNFSMKVTSIGKSLKNKRPSLNGGRLL
ncbi:hypothetical protein [Halobacillus naozhouensis]|uniref:hypothetical protein n=1 Tax=Halobacillus naozhouensis TaxID=554880 RepID=UPI003D15F998